MLPDTEYAADEHLSSGDRVDQAGAPGVQCSVCSSIFRRPEHLKRHLRSHTKEKPFECIQCGRHFSRTDTLHRHELSHHTQGSDGGKDRTHRITVKTFRACFGCAMARVRCSGGSPCGRCDTRSLECQYPTERRSKAKPRNGAPRRMSITENQGTKSTRTPSPSSFRNNTEPHLIDGTMSFQLAHLPVSGTNDSSQAHITSLQEHSANPSTGQHNLNGKASLANGSNSQLYMPPNSDSTNPQVPPATHSKEHCPQPYESNVDSKTPAFYTDETSKRIPSDMRQIQQDLPGSAANMDLDMASNSRIPVEFDPSFFDNPMLPTINWLPNEFFPSGDQIQRMSTPSNCSQPVALNSTASNASWQAPVISAGHGSSSLLGNRPPTLPGKFYPGTDKDSPRKNSHIASDASSIADSVNSAERSLHYYVNGGDARLPRYGKKHSSWTTSPDELISPKEPPSERKPQGFRFPTAYETHLENIPEDILGSLKPIEASRHAELYNNFLQLCRTENPFFELFDSVHFPTADQCSHCVVYFFDSFQTVYPILHLSTFDPNQCHWLLTLTIVAMGCHFSGGPEADNCSAAFHEMTRRAFLAEKNKDNSTRNSLDLVQAMLLNCIGLLHSGYEGDQRFALGRFSEIVALSSHNKLLASHSESRPEWIELSDEAQWAQWIQGEVRRRTGYCIWLLDSMLAYYFDERPLFSLDDGQAALPVHETLWQANSAEAWKQQRETSTVGESLYDAVHILFIEKRLVAGIGEFSHILLIHALHQRMWEVGDYFRRPLSFWNPTAKKQSCESAIPKGAVWLPGIPSYSKWRNSACDCLDILHWTANSTIAKAAGLEHPTVLHLHNARLVLLTPFREIRSLAISLATNRSPWTKRSQTLEWQYIWRWVKHDQYKARLAIIHAGVTLWHIRRYSTNAFHEPVAAFLAILTLWAYGSCHANGPHSSSPRPEINRAEPSFIHLDRPCDDELVQLFVREGHVMRGNVTGVGDICALEGPERLLRAGCETLSSLTAWGISKELVAILMRLADIMAQNRDLEQSHKTT